MFPFPASEAFAPKESAESLTAYALRGDVRAQWQLALDYRNGGNGLPKDLTKVLAWLERAALGGYRDAMLLLGSLLKMEARTQDAEYRSPPCFARAASWFLKAHRAGHPAAMAELDQILREFTREESWVEDPRDEQLELTQAALGSLLAPPWQQDFPAHRQGPTTEVDLRIPRLARLRCPFCGLWAAQGGLEEDRWGNTEFEGGPVTLVVHRPKACCAEHGPIPVVLPVALLVAGFKWIPNAGGGRA